MSATNVWALFDGIADNLRVAIAAGGVAALADLRYAMVASTPELAALQMRGYPSIAIIPGEIETIEQYTGGGYKLRASVDVVVIARFEDALRQYSAKQIYGWAAAIRERLHLATIGVTGLQYFTHQQTGPQQIMALADYTGGEHDVFLQLPVSFEAHIIQEV